MKKVSVIITTYNSESTIQRALTSLKNQEGIGDDFSLEIIIVDDCSNDNTRQLIQENQLAYISTGTNSGGPNKGRNTGLSKATGDFICIMDHDDEWLPGKIKSQVALSHLAPIISTGYYEKDDVNNKIREYVNTSSDFSGHNLYGENETFLNHLTRSRKGQKSYIGGLMYDRSLKEILFEEEFSMVDFDWFLRLFHNRASVEVCKPMFIRHISGTNLSLDETYRINDYKYSLQTLDNYRKKYPVQVKKSRKKINGTMARYYYKMENMKKSRKYFLESELTIKNLGYFITSWYGYKYVNKRFKVF
jgi:glycosyltransferase involved in cell wall biosynthesis